MAFDQVKYQNEFNKQKYDRASINFPKGRKEVIESHWRKKGYESLNAYVNDLIRRDMNEPAEEKSVSKNISIGRDNNGNINM